MSHIQLQDRACAAVDQGNSVQHSWEYVPAPSSILRVINVSMEFTAPINMLFVTRHVYPRSKEHHFKSSLAYMAKSWLPIVTLNHSNRAPIVDFPHETYQPIDTGKDLQQPCHFFFVMGARPPSVCARSRFFTEEVSPKIMDAELDTGLWNQPWTRLNGYPNNTFGIRI